MDWKKRIVDLTIRAAEEAVRDRVQEKFRGVNEILDVLNPTANSGAPQMSQPWPEWYTDAVNSPALPLSPNDRAVFSGRERERRVDAEQRGRILMDHMKEMHNTMMSGFRSN